MEFLPDLLCFVGVRKFGYGKVVGVAGNMEYLFIFYCL